MGKFGEVSHRIKKRRGMRAAAYKVDFAMRPPQARVSQAKLFVMFKYLTWGNYTLVRIGIQ
ncbi:hypothetical protein D3Z62_21975 [Lachnospiraceae bacterium]|nr:hypothetical protein [Lachnospiraceae bacterium]